MTSELVLTEQTPLFEAGAPEFAAAVVPPSPRRAARGRAPVAEITVPLRKPVNTLAIVPKSQRITSLGRKSYNVLLFEAQSQGLDKDVFSAPLERIIRGVDFDSNDQELIKKHLRAMVSTTVEWQSPTTGEGTTWNVSGLLAHARLSKIRGQVWVEWSYAVNLKQELLQPTVFARLSLEIISQLRSHAGIALYEICSRYKDIGRTSRQAWAWWRPVLSGRPENEKTAKLEYRIFKRDTLKPAIAEVCAITDIDVELVEHKAGRFVSELQFLIRPKAREAMPPRQPPQPVDLSAVTQARVLGIDDNRAEELIETYGQQAFTEGLEALRKRLETAFPEPLRDPFRYLKALLSGEATQRAAKAAIERHDAPAASPAESAAAARSEEDRAAQARREARWTEAWIRQRREQIVRDIAGLSAEEQARLSQALLEDMEARQVHPSIRKRLQTSGWQHALVVAEMIRFYAVGAIGDDWDRPTPEQLLAIASQLGDGAPGGRGT
ncbi:replication initiation protein [Aquincola tertiaricarbonis]|uniref:Replication initiation protein n=1 Tax=Aquincola tertiaricarbonis TaxID=391953 RepID=A0ABY4S052_AQUTE|nr:replication initiation protein [Aquincola tertiaricarbonis]URI05769.1 replication initiation protein [Aquincola tertiaricarbonis]